MSTSLIFIEGMDHTFGEEGTLRPLSTFTLVLPSPPLSPTLALALVSAPLTSHLSLRIDHPHPGTRMKEKCYCLLSLALSPPNQQSTGTCLRSTRGSL